MKAVLVALMNRLAAFARAEPAAIPGDVDMLGTFRTHVAQMSAASVGVAGVLDLQASGDVGWVGGWVGVSVGMAGVLDLRAGSGLRGAGRGVRRGEVT